MATAAEIQEKVDKLAVNMDRFDVITNGDAQATVTTDAGPTPSVANLFRQIRENVFNVPVPFVSGLSVTSGAFTVEEGGVIYAARPSEVPFTTTSTFDGDQWYPVVGGIDNDVLYVSRLNLDDTGATDLSSVIQPYIGGVSEIVFPAGTFYAALDVSSPVTIRGAGKGRTILTTEALSSGLTLDVNANLNLRDITVKCHATSASARTISHDGSFTVIATNVEFSGCNHDAAKGLLSAAIYKLCDFHNGPQPAALGVLAHSPLAHFWYCVFTGGRTVEAKDSIFYWCFIGDEDETNTAVHMPDGATANDGSPTGFSGNATFYDTLIRAKGAGITEGNDCHAVLRRCDVRADYGGGAGAALYARSKSTFDVEDSYIWSKAGTALSFAKTAPQDPNNIGLSGESIIKRSRLEGGFTSLAVPAQTEVYPTSIGNVVLVDCDIVGGDNEISPKTSTYYVLKTEKFWDWTESLTYTDNDTTQRFRYKSDNMMVTVTGSDGPRTGCHLSHLDALTGLPHPDGMEIWVKYGGVSSRFVTFANGTTDDSGAMYFADNASTLATTQFGIYKFRLDNTTWKQVDG